MPTALGIHAPRLRAIAKLATVKGRREAGRFAFEGPTLLDEARRSGAAIAELYVTQRAYAEHPALAQTEAGGVPVYLIDDRSAAKLSDVQTPTGIVGIAVTHLRSLPELLAAPGVVLVLAGVGDPANAGTLLRSAEAFGAAGVAFGDGAVDPYHPKVVRGGMGAHFRLALASAAPSELVAAARAAGASIVGLAAGAHGLRGYAWPERCALVVGHERHGLGGGWEAACDRLLGIPIRPGADSLNAAVAGSIALFEACQ